MNASTNARLHACDKVLDQDEDHTSLRPGALLEERSAFRMVQAVAVTAQAWRSSIDQKPLVRQNQQSWQPSLIVWSLSWSVFSS
jgi:hypothetical protein